MKRRFLAVLVALALALLGSLAVVAYVRSADERALAGREAVRVLVATKVVPAGTSAAQLRTGGFVERVVMPAETVPADALGELDKALDSLVLTAELKPRQLLLRGMFDESAGVTGGLAVPDGRLAVSVEVTAAGQVAGFVRPGSKVAIFDTFTMQSGRGRIPSGDGLTSRSDANHATRVVLPRVDVIAVGERGTEGAATSAPSPGAEQESGTEGSGKAKSGVSVMITVAVNQQEAEKLIHVAQTGVLYLALLDDNTQIEPGPGIDNNSLFPA